MAVYKFKLEHDYVYDLGIKPLKDLSLKDRGTEWALLQKSGILIIRKEYAWNGCSPMWNILDLFSIGTPDGIVDIRLGKPKTYFASLVHDVLYQFAKQLRGVLKRKQADKEFLKILGLCDFMLKWLYYGFVRSLGWLFWKGY